MKQLADPATWMVDGGCVSQGNCFDVEKRAQSRVNFPLKQNYRVKDDEVTMIDDR